MKIITLLVIGYWLHVWGWAQSNSSNLIKEWWVTLYLYDRMIIKWPSRIPPKLQNYLPTILLRGVHHKCITYFNDFAIPIPYFGGQSFKKELVWKFRNAIQFSKIKKEKIQNPRQTRHFRYSRLHCFRIQLKPFCTE